MFKLAKECNFLKIQNSKLEMDWTQVMTNEAPPATDDIIIYNLLKCENKLFCVASLVKQRYFLHSKKGTLTADIGIYQIISNGTKKISGV